MESIWTIIFSIILVLALVAQLQMLIVHPKKLCKIFHYRGTSSTTHASGASSPKLLQYYPKVPTLLDAGSDSNLLIARLRSIFSAPVLPHGLPNDVARTESTVLLPASGRSSVFVRTEEVLPVVDITCNYNSCRYKALEVSLRNRYGDDYPPGKVLLNSMQLNYPDSRTRVDRKINGGLFDFIRESEATLIGSGKPKAEYLDPLDHFVTRRTGRPSTVEKFTEIVDGDEGEEVVPSCGGGCKECADGRANRGEKKSGNQRFSRGVEEATRGKEGTRNSSCNGGGRLSSSRRFDGRTDDTKTERMTRARAPVCAKKV